jgi:hypothetical protein
MKGTSLNPWITASRAVHHDVIMGGTDAALRRRRYPSVEALKCPTLPRGVEPNTLSVDEPRESSIRAKFSNNFSRALTRVERSGPRSLDVGLARTGEKRLAPDGPLGGSIWRIDVLTWRVTRHFSRTNSISVASKGLIVSMLAWPACLIEQRVAYRGNASYPVLLSG